ncbi:MAG: DUF4878 domain-containing protein [Treponema sp.]|jgi:hypothetical protein|nr:DUF4878 domain-containing protein [Treponema sp.]
MKKGILYGLLAFILVTGFGFIGCDTGTNDNAGGPKDVVLQFVQALQRKDWSTAKSYCTEDSAYVIDIALAFGEDFQDLNEVVDATLEETITGDTAFVYNSDSPEDGFDLVNQNGQWKIDLSSFM